MDANMNNKNFKQIKVGKSYIGANHPPFIIAEMSGNHNQSLKRALEIVDAVASSGAQALKIQTYTPDTMTIDLNEREFHISDENSLWKGKSLYDLYGEAHTPWEWHEEIFTRARKKGLIPFSSPFDATAVDFLEDLDVEIYKIASFENTDIPLIKKVAATGKPMIISTGMATVSELDESVRAARDSGCDNLILLKCTSTYPALPINSNLRTIEHLKDLFDCEVGLSDHTLGIGAAIASVGMGATVIEKHFTLDRGDGGVDSAFSLEPKELEFLVTESCSAWQSLGSVNYGTSKSEKNSIQFRRSLYIVEDLKKGDKITINNLRAIRPGLGLPPKYINSFIGKTIKNDVQRGTPLSWDLI
jgi:pseudaminic acid synthase